MIMKLGANEIQAGIYTCLNNALSSICAVYDEVPQEEVKLPYVTLGDDSSIPWNMSKRGSFGRQFNIEVKCWSKKPQFKEVKNIAEKCVEALGDPASPGFSISGFQIIYFDISATFQRDPDGRTRNGHLNLTINAMQMSTT